MFAPPTCRVDDGSDHPLPETLLVERELEPPPTPAPTRRNGRRIIHLSEMDAPPRRRIDRIDVDGHLQPVAPIEGDGLREASDARPLPTGGYRYLRVNADGTSELVTIDRRGASTATGAPGGGRAPALGGFHSARRAPFGDDGRYSVVIDVEVQPPSVIVRDAVNDQMLSRVSPPEDTAQPYDAFLAEGTSDVLLCMRSGTGTVVRLVGSRATSDFRMEMRECVAADRQLSWLVGATTTDDGHETLVAQQVGHAERVLLGAGQLAAFDRCAQVVVVAQALAGDSRTELRRVPLDGRPTTLATLAGVLDTLEVTSDGMVVAARLPQMPHNDEPARAFVVRLAGGNVHTFPLPPDAAVVTHVP